MKRISTLLAFFVFCSGVFGCAENNEAAEDASSTVVEFTIEGLTINGPDQISSGWTTFRVVNNSAMTHFVLLDKMPEGKTIDDHVIVARVFQKGMSLLNEGKPEEGFAAFGELPEWFAGIIFSGGPGFVGPGETIETTLFVEPGLFVAECYVKTNGVFHSFNPVEGQYGMVHQITVSENANELNPPTPTSELTISSERGIEGGTDLAPGAHVIAVHFEDQIAHENFLGHDVQLARLEEDTDVEFLQHWMNYINTDGLVTPAPVTFLGGANEMPAGNTAYIHVSLVPGRYAWISEVPNPGSKGMYVEFEVR